MSEYEKQLEDAVEKLQALLLKLSSDDKSNLVYMFKPKGDYKFIFSSKQEVPSMYKTLKDCVLYLCTTCHYVYNDLIDERNGNIILTNNTNIRTIFERLGMKYNIYSFNLDTFEETLVFPLQPIKMDTL